MTTTSPIGVFDSGVGGLTVYKALEALLPSEDFVYLGDTARLPYGTKSTETITQYVVQAAHLLMESEIKLLVVACNTASALALPHLSRFLPSLPCLGVIEPSAAEAVRQTKSGKIAVLATEGTVRSEAYVKAIRRLKPTAHVQSLACNLLVGLVEEGWYDGDEAQGIVRRYLSELDDDFDTIVLGCTHFPLLAPLLKDLLRPNVAMVDSASVTARSVEAYLDQHNLRSSALGHGYSRFLVTDSPERFDRLAQRFLERDIVGAIISSYLAPTAPSIVSDELLSSTVTAKAI